MIEGYLLPRQSRKNQTASMNSQLMSSSLGGSNSSAADLRDRSTTAWARALRSIVFVLPLPSYRLASSKSTSFKQLDNRRRCGVGGAFDLDSMFSHLNNQAFIPSRKLR